MTTVLDDWSRFISIVFRSVALESDIYFCSVAIEVSIAPSRSDTEGNTLDLRVK